jgi:hypothetical protein
MPMRVIGMKGHPYSEWPLFFNTYERTRGERNGVCYPNCYRSFPRASLMALAALSSLVANKCA